MILMVLEFTAGVRFPGPAAVGGPRIERASAWVVIVDDAGRRPALLQVPAEGLPSTGHRAAPALSPAVHSAMWSRHPGFRRNR